jgi:hypothetical protein
MEVLGWGAGDGALTLGGRGVNFKNVLGLQNLSFLMLAERSRYNENKRYI